jgi:predicted nucleic acid-binding protein
VADANALYSRVLRDYLLIAAEREMVQVYWSPQILDDVTRRLQTNRPSFDADSSKRLVGGMTRVFPDSTVQPLPEHFARLEGFALPDDDDRDVIATALSAEAEIICTSNTKHFPNG